jgi:hypothetical protein
MRSCKYVFVEFGQNLGILMESTLSFRSRVYIDHYIDALFHANRPTWIMGMHCPEKTPVASVTFTADQVLCQEGHPTGSMNAMHNSSELAVVRLRPNISALVAKIDRASRFQTVVQPTVRAMPFILLVDKPDRRFY